jgi:alpha-N-arabinofuranosidase
MKMTAVIFGIMMLVYVSFMSAEDRPKFKNPILAGFYPDPSLCKVDGDYYLVNSSFSYFPGIPVFHSKDLVHWELIGHALDRAEQLNLDDQGVSRGIYAPTIRHSNGRYYITCTLVDIGGNFVITSKNPAGPWSNPVWLPQINGIDPSLFFDTNGKTYILYNSIPPDDKPLYDGHRTIRMRAFDIDSLKTVGDEILLVDGGSDIKKKPAWIEGPHIFKKDGYYYLIAAEGGTGDQHSEVVFRSKQVTGPYSPFDKNPILTQRNLDPNRKFPITCTGHADFIQTDAGEWWSVFLGSRPYQPYAEGYTNTGRETYQAPVKWVDGWPIINPGFEQVQYYSFSPLQQVVKPDMHPYNGNFILRDEFDQKVLHPDWVFLRTPHEQWYNLKDKKGYLTIKLRPEMCSGTENPSFIGRRQQHAFGSASVSMNFLPKNDDEKAGLLIFQNEEHFYFLCKSVEGNEPVVQLFKSNKISARDTMELVASRKILNEESPKEVFLKIEARGKTYAFFYSLEPAKWSLLKEGVDATWLSTRVAGGFVGSMYAMYATSSGKVSTNTASYDWFEYQGNDEVYKELQ